GQAVRPIAISVGLRPGQLGRRNARGVNSDQGVSSARLRLRRILVHQLLRTAFLMESNGFHCGFLSSLSMPRLAFCLSSLRRSLTGPGYNFGEASGFFSCRFPPKNFVYAERGICARSEERRSPGRRKNREIEGPPLLPTPRSSSEQRWPEELHSAKQRCECSNR